MRVNRNNEPIYIEILLSAIEYHRHELKEFFLSQVKIIQNNYHVKEFNMKDGFIRQLNLLEKYIVEKTELEKAIFNNENMIHLVSFDYEGETFFLNIENFSIVKEELIKVLFQYKTINQNREKWFYVILEYALGSFKDYNNSALKAPEIAEIIKEKYELREDIPTNYISEIRYNNPDGTKNYLRDSKKIKIVYEYCLQNSDTIKITDEFINIYNQLK
ncbi:MAG: hypothetical protein BGO86_05705 [Chryseobacterium sp. 36-9]|nr:MAG: hypothetical protein BGO86_05705 [Chryseobacterium sp. 36-9]